ncbi:MAG: hypothetical protein H6677_23420 [Candidatus Obscuribacterales bacterium]|nr:hypothetical protein [Candidatus Obscuribacterales bacterium]
MARLQSEDREYMSAFEISPESPIERHQSYPDQAIQYFSWRMTQGKRLISSAKEQENKTAEAPLEKDGYIFFREPEDEVKLLISRLESLAEGKVDTVLFEPFEPSVDLRIERPDRERADLKVYVFIDEGGVETGISRWDALGLRFLTNTEMLSLFIKDLKSEFNC